MQQKKHRNGGNGTARRRTKSASDQPADVVAQREQIATFDERVATPDYTDDDAIRTRAYYLFLERGARAGHDLEDWLRAEREIRA